MVTQASRQGHQREEGLDGDETQSKRHSPRWSPNIASIINGHVPSPVRGAGQSDFHELPPFRPSTLHEHQPRRAGTNRCPREKQVPLTMQGSRFPSALMIFFPKWSLGTIQAQLKGGKIRRKNRPHQNQLKNQGKKAGPTRTRTWDPLIMSPIPVLDPQRMPTRGVGWSWMGSSVA